MAEPISLDEAALNLRVDLGAEDVLISGLIVAAREHVEDHTGLVLTPRAITETAPTLGRWIDLASWPVTSVVAIRYPVDGVMTALAPGSWRTSLLRRPVRILPAVPRWIAGYAECTDDRSRGLPAHAVPDLPVEIDVLAGYATPDDVPSAVKQAMHLLISHFYTNRSAVEAGVRAAAVEMPLGVEVLLRRYRPELV